MKAINFTCHGNSSPAYSCNEPGDNSGIYVPLSELIDAFPDRDVVICVDDDDTYTVTINDDNKNHLSEGERLSKIIEEHENRS